jgi:ferrous-iron efflux pump FieF
VPAARLRNRAALASVAVASVLITAKLAAWLLTGSVVMLTSLIDSGADLLASCVTLVGVRHAMQPPDAAHRFGHGKAEPLAALAQSGFVLGSMLLLLYEASLRLIEPRPVEQPEIAIGVMGFAVALTLALVLYQRHVIRRTGSIAIAADRMHYAADLLTNLAVIGALALTALTGIARLDPLFALAIAGMMVWWALGIGRGAFDMLMDRELPEADRARIERLVLAHPEARGVHDMRSRRAGPTLFIELHLELDGRLTLAHAHTVAHEIEDEIRHAFPHAEVLIHQEPADVKDERLDDLIERNGCGRI